MAVLLGALRAVRELRRNSRERETSIARLKNEKDLLNQFSEATRRHLRYVVHTALTLDGRMFMGWCAEQGAFDYSHILEVLLRSRAFTPEEREQLQNVAAGVKSLLADAGLSTSVPSHESALLGFAVVADGKKCASYAAKHGLPARELLQSFFTLPHLDESGRKAVTLALARLPAEG
jgi:hypothetical protein